MSQSKAISRRAALARLGLTAASVYMSPGIMGISMAHAASSVSDASQSSAATPPSPPSPPSVVSATSGPSSAGSCQQTTLPGGANITRQDYARAQRAIQRGEARPLREILRNVQSRHPGTFLRVGYSESGRSPAFRVVIVNASGAIVTVTVDAKSGQITNVQNC